MNELYTHKLTNVFTTSQIGNASFRPLVSPCCTHLTQERLTSTINAKFTRNAHLLRRLPHGAHALLHVKTRMAGPFHHIDHTFHTGPAVHADIPDTRYVPQIPDGARKESMTCDRLDGYHKTFAFRVPGRSSESLP